MPTLCSRDALYGSLSCAVAVTSRKRELQSLAVPYREQPSSHRACSSAIKLIPSNSFLFIYHSLMATADKSSVGPPHFSEPWKFSDVVLVVEGQKLHVHRSTLAIWSPVFDTMFTSDFKEKNSVEIPLPGKKANEMKLLLQIMYDTSWNRSIMTEENCYFLLDLAHEYQIASIIQLCEDFLVSMVKGKKTDKDVLTVLLVGQKYELKTLLQSCVSEARNLSLNELKRHNKRSEIDQENYQHITDGIIARLEEENRTLTNRLGYW